MRLKSCKNMAFCAGMALILLLICAGSYFHVLGFFELHTLDLRFRLRPPIQVNDDIVIIEIGDYTISQLGQFPIDRGDHAILVKALSEHGAKAVVFDIFFSEQNENDAQFAESIQQASNVYLPHILDVASRNKRGAILKASGYTAKTLKQLTDAAKGTGHINIIPDIDGKYRRIPAVIKLNDTLVPYLSVLAACDYLKADFKKASLKAGKSIIIGPELKVPLDENSNIIVNFTGKWGKRYPHYSYVDVLKSYIAKFNGEKPILDLDKFKGKVCMVGLTAAGSTDLHPNPFEALYPAVGLHADIFNSIVTKNFITRAPYWANLFILLVLFTVILITALKTRPLIGFGILAGLALVFVCFAVLLFDLFGLWVDIFYPLAMMLAVYLFCTLFKYMTEWKKRLVFENELEIAKKIQESFLPDTFPACPGADIAACMLTALKVGGDLYDLLEFSPSSFAAMVGDVSGKGIPASLFMAKADGAFKFFAKQETPPDETLLHLNEKLIKDSTSNLFVTVFYSKFDMAKKTMHYASGGHLPLLYLPRGHKTRYLDAEDGLPLGLMSCDYSGHSMSFDEGDIFVFYTDGITEARNTRGGMYEAQRLERIVEKNRMLTAAGILDAVTRDVKAFARNEAQSDDITLIVVKMDAVPTA